MVIPELADGGALPIAALNYPKLKGGREEVSGGDCD